LSVVQGDYTTFDAFSKGIQGHERLLMSIADINIVPQVMGKFANLAYTAGVKQVVDISGFNVKHFNGSGDISLQAGRGENAIRKEAEEQGGYFVIIRGGDFMTNILRGEAHSVKSYNKIRSAAKESRITTLVDPRDVGDVAASILSDNIEKHGNTIYDCQTEALSYTERIAIYSRVLGRKIEYEQIGVVEMYNTLVQYGISHRLAYDYINLSQSNFNDPTPQIEILLKKKPRTFEDFVHEYRSAFE
jgi:uncharacterized protein YbjT (DUF2867 family)